MLNYAPADVHIMQGLQHNKNKEGCLRYMLTLSVVFVISIVETGSSTEPQQSNQRLGCQPVYLLFHHISLPTYSINSSQGAP